MKIPRRARDQFELDSTEFHALFAEELRPDPTLTGLKLLKEKAHNEERLREAYEGRAMYELLQNARDAGAARAAFVLCADGLAFLHDGRWFTVGNFRSLVDGWSDKRPGECIGHKGLGFRSVLEVSPSPFIIRVQPGSFWGIRFSWSQNQAFIQEALSNDSTLLEHYQAWTAEGRNVCPVLYLPNAAKKGQLYSAAKIYDRASDGGYGGAWTTMVWLPARDQTLDPQIRTRMGISPFVTNGDGPERLCQFLRAEAAGILPYIRPLSSVTAHSEEQTLGSVSQLEARGDESDEDARIETRIGDERAEQVFFRMAFSFAIPADISSDPATPHAVRFLDSATVVLSLLIGPNGPIGNPDARFHVYFPTEERTGFGFSIHGDFYLHPNRTHLMGGRYNEWLLDRAAEAAAGPFLSRLIERFPSRTMIESLRPRSSAFTSSAKRFRESFAARLKSREEPFVPTRAGWKSRTEVAMPPRVDTAAFWHDHFSDVVTEITSYRALLSPEADSEGARAFFGIADIAVLEPRTFLDLMEAKGALEPEPVWWNDCYVALQSDPVLSRLPDNEFTGRRLLPTVTGVLPVPEADQRIVVMPRAGTEDRLHVPRGFAHVFEFLDPEVAELLQLGSSRVLDWVRTNLRTVSFEPTDLLPRAIRRSVGSLYSGEIHLTRADLLELWSFVAQIRGGRAIESDSFWQELGRLPLPSMPCGHDAVEEPATWLPAFLTFWPEALDQPNDSCHGVPGLPRMDMAFFSELVKATEQESSVLREFFRRVGVHGHPRVLRYSRVVASGEELPLSLASFPPDWAGRYTGDRQRDENRAVIRTLTDGGHWHDIVQGMRTCSHDANRVIQQVRVLHCLSHLIAWAELEWSEDPALGSQRLWRLIHAVPSSELAQGADQAYCFGGGGHSVEGSSTLQRQLDGCRWLPSSRGPVSRSEAFARQQHQRLISRGREEEELGDLLFPYVVAPDSATMAQLDRLGIEILDGSAATADKARARALWMLGDQLSTDWGKQNIIANRGRWRRVRAAIQDLYTALNLSSGAYPLHPGTRFAARRNGEIAFISDPIYYADPGSNVERAFRDDLWLIDVDRRYPNLFSKVGVTDLSVAGTVREYVVREAEATPAVDLHSEICEQLSKYLLAPLQARTDDPVDAPLRRLRERLEVLLMSEIEVEFQLNDPPITRRVPTPHFYLRRKVVPGTGAIRENHYALFVRGSSATTIDQLDADALGSVLADVALQGEHAGIAALFPRISAKYKEYGGDPQRMQEFLHVQLGVSVEAQDATEAKVSDTEMTFRPAASTPAPPPHFIAPTVRIPQAAGEGAQHRTSHRVQDLFVSEGQALIQSLFPTVGGETHLRGNSARSDDESGESVGPPPRRSISRITPEQQARGRRGEDEILRRLRQPDGWGGFRYLSDCREQDVGYDFLAEMGGQEVEIEVKTFAPNGRIVVPFREVRQAARTRDSYYLIGLLDDGAEPQTWPAFVVGNPFDLLIEHGRFEHQPHLAVAADAIFPFLTPRPE